jgi:hypothetical protein
VQTQNEETTPLAPKIENFEGMKLKLNQQEILEQCKKDYTGQLEKHFSPREQRYMAKLMEARENEREKKQNHGVEMTVHLCVQRVFGRKIGRLAAKKLAKLLVRMWFRPSSADRELLQLRGRLRQLWNEEWRNKKTKYRNKYATFSEIYKRGVPDNEVWGAKDEIGYPIWLRNQRRYHRCALRDMRTTKRETYKRLIKFNLICLFSLMKQNQSNAN